MAPLNWNQPCWLSMGHRSENRTNNFKNEFISGYNYINGFYINYQNWLNALNCLMNLWELIEMIPNINGEKLLNYLILYCLWASRRVVMPCLSGYLMGLILLYLLRLSFFVGKRRQRSTLLSSGSRQTNRCYSCGIINWKHEWIKVVCRKFKVLNKLRLNCFYDFKCM